MNCRVRRCSAGLDYIKRATHDNAAPLKELSVFVYFEDNASVSKEFAELTSSCGSAIDPTVFVDVVHRYDAHPVLQRKTNPSHSVAGENGFALLESIEYSKERRFVSRAGGGGGGGGAGHELGGGTRFQKCGVVCHGGCSY